MTTPLPVSGLTPYITPALLRSYPTGLEWDTIPPERTATESDTNAALANICATATTLVDECCKQPLRATVDTIPLYGPGVRVGVDRSGCKPTDLILKRWPVLEVVSVQVAPNKLPWVFSNVPSSEYQVKHPVAGLYGSSAPTAAGEGGQAVLLNPGWVKWDRGRDGYVVMVANVNGWPHCGLTGPAAQGATSLTVDDCTGWTISAPFAGAPTGATGTIYDAGAQEVIHVTAASVAQGPGVLTLSSPLQYQHLAGVMVSSLPQSAVWAAALYCCSVALERGATATTVQEIPGKAIAEQAGVKGPGGPAKWAECILKGTFDRII